MSYLSSIAGEFASYTPAQEVNGERIEHAWDWHSNASQNPVEPGYWLQVRACDNEPFSCAVTIRETHAPQGPGGYPEMVYGIIGYCVYHELKYELE